MDTRDPLQVRWEEIQEPEAGIRLDTEIQAWAGHTDRHRAIHYYIKYRRAAYSELLRDVDHDVFLEELERGAAPSKELVHATAQAFLSAALRLPIAQTFAGWHGLVTTSQLMLGTAPRSLSRGGTGVALGTAIPPRLPPFGLAPPKRRLREARRNRLTRRMLRGESTGDVYQRHRIT